MATRYFLDIHHPGLCLSKRVIGPSEDTVHWKAQNQLAVWEQRWSRMQDAEQKRATRERSRESKAAERAYKESRKQEALDTTAAAEHELESLERILTGALGKSAKVDFKELSARDPAPPPPILLAVPPAPSPTCRDYVAPPVTFFTSVMELVSSKAKAERLARQAAEALALRAEDDHRNAGAHADWQRRVLDIEKENARRKVAFDAAGKQWQQRRNELEQRRAAYLAGDAGAVEHYCDMVLSKSVYADYFPKTFDAQYAAAERLLAIEYVLPEPDDLPRTKAVKYVASNDDMVESEISEAAAKKLYDSVVYQVILRTVHELFDADVANVLDAVAMNAIVETIDRATGKPVRPCIASIHVTKSEFQTFQLKSLEPKACFRRLKGVGSSELVALVPVAPIVQLSRDDARFIDGREVLSGVGAGTNLAAMDWQEFEHLVRQLLESEFATGAAEVRVTQASRDGGVDAVVFDPDPLHGGKFVVQAKRYTNTVPVAAVRELWGTMNHEHAAKGILVTTASYGPDSYEFAKDKPITLIDGSNLLFLLQKHGTRAFIDIKKARAASA